MSLEVGKIVNGVVTGVTKFGAFLDIGDGKTGMVHISEVAATYVKEISDYIKRGDEVSVKVIQIADDGKIALSIKQAMPEEERKAAIERARQERPPRREFKKPQPFLGVKNSFADKQAVPEGQSFEDMMSSFKQSSDDRMLDIKRNLEGKKGSRGRGGGR